MNIATVFELCSTMYFHTSKTYIQVFLSKFKFDPSLIIYLCNLEPTDKYTYMTYTHTHTHIHMQACSESNEYCIVL